MAERSTFRWNLLRVPFLLSSLSQLTWASCGEKPAMVCYTASNGATPQNVSISDIAYVANYLRYIGRSNTGQAAMWSMPANIDCQEWELPVDDGGTVLPLAKHIGHRYNSSTLYSDLADAIDGGLDANDTQKAQSLIGTCGTAGGMVGVNVNASNPAYNTPEYLASGAKPTGILVKIVHSAEG